ncbi:MULTISPECIES: DUF2589 domain-containing protein [Pseudomonas]|uniref:DUF2589 domain-containing protein n=1 Tax=Pseudomonas TaxID=286 RepID=UPI0007B6F0E2|nr:MULTISPECIES: DUF2589 domain-containing protein [Pseudomonas]QXI45375.1 DUF2589 domain-containing protein [Pseudomonas wayambapalatensis]ANC03684.1 hypothetical protein AB688_16730 [Pseudomonas putida]KAB5625781.1 DUF2589 domain-containing protein [Pseudomonas putida]MBC3421378.1 DUF2589 domain-containing protein [Pseudomonas sp. RW3S2]MBC3464017.1 DUF2589 domain-containing protein [Pseudomonas sp. RW10S2]
MSDFVMGNQFRGLPMADLIGAPLSAACDAQVRLANATANFIKVIGFLPPADPANAGPNDVGDIRNVSFRYDRSAPTEDDPAAIEKVELQLPLLAVVKVPNLAINKVDISFDMEVRNSEQSRDTEDRSGSFSAEAKLGWGPFSAKVNVSGSVASHKENTRSTDQSAKYHVEVHAVDDGMPEGLARVMDIIAQSVTPKIAA